MRPISIFPSFSVLCFLVFLSGNIWGADRCDIGLKSAQTDISRLKNNIIDQATKDLPTFCQWNQMDQVVEKLSKDAKKKYAKLKSKGNLNEAGAFLASQLRESTDIWRLSMVGHPSIKNLAKTNSFLKHCPDDQEMACKSASNEHIAQAISKKFENYSLKIPNYKPLKSGSTANSVLKVGACLVFGDTQLSPCSNAIEKIQKLMETQSFETPEVFLTSKGKSIGLPMMPSFGSSMVTAKPVIEKILTDRAATEGLRLAALKLLKRQEGTMPSQANIFDDMKSSFIESGLSESEADSKTWDALGALASSGPNFAKRWSQHNNMLAMNLNRINENPNAFLMQTIAEAIPKLDTKKAEQHGGAVYSLPAGVNFPCDSGKNYHFWMTAYLARNLTLAGVDPKTASSSSYIADIGYQIQRENFAGTEINMSAMQHLGPIENEIRMDLVLAASGSKFGANSAQNLETKIDIANEYRNSLKRNADTNKFLGALYTLLPGLPGQAVGLINRTSPNDIFKAIHQ